MIGCRAPAHTADADHTRDHGHGGPTTGGNLGAASANMIIGSSTKVAGGCTSPTPVTSTG